MHIDIAEAYFKKIKFAKYIRIEHKTKAKFLYYKIYLFLLGVF